MAMNSKDPGQRQIRHLDSSGNACYTASYDTQGGCCDGYLYNLTLSHSLEYTFHVNTSEDSPISVHPTKVGESKENGHTLTYTRLLIDLDKVSGTTWASLVMRPADASYQDTVVNLDCDACEVHTNAAIVVKKKKSTLSSQRSLAANQDLKRTVTTEKVVIISAMSANGAQRTHLSSSPSCQKHRGKKAKKTKRGADLICPAACETECAKNAESNTSAENVMSKSTKKGQGNAAKHCCSKGSR